MGKSSDEFTNEEAERRFQDAIRRALTTPHKTLKEFVGKTPRARGMARRRKAKGYPKS